MKMINYLVKHFDHSDSRYIKLTKNLSIQIIIVLKHGKKIIKRKRKSAFCFREENSQTEFKRIFLKF